MESIIFDFHDANYETWEKFIKSSTYREQPKKEAGTIRYSNHLNNSGSTPESKSNSTEVLE